MKRFAIKKSDREIAAVLLMRLARHVHSSFCLSWVYDDDTDFLLSIAKDLNLGGGFSGESFIRRLRKICRRLENYGVLSGRLSSCHAEYLGEPRVLKSYQFGEPGYACRLAPELHQHYKPMGKTETELSILLDRPYPEEEKK